MTISVSAQIERAGTHARAGLPVPSMTRGESHNHCPEPCAPTVERRMFAVTVALSEPANGCELDWAATIASNLRVLYAGTTVEIIDTWRTDA